MHKYIYLFIIFFTHSLLAEELSSCYSIQLQSSKEKVSQISKFPTQCKEIEISSYRTIRCGCFTTSDEAKKSLQHYRERYPNAILVQTYKYRFQQNKESTKPVETIQKEEPKQKEKKDWTSLTSLLYQDILLSNTPSTVDTNKEYQKDIKEQLLQNQVKKGNLLLQQSNFYGLSLQGKYEQYINQDYRFREYTDYEYDLKLQFDLFKDGYFEHKKRLSIVNKKENIKYIQDLSHLLKNNYDEQLLIINAAISQLSYKYYLRLQTLYKEALQHRVDDYVNSISTQSEIEEIQQMLNRFKKTAAIYKEHKTIKIPKEVYQLIQNIQNIELTDYETVLKYAKTNNTDIKLQKAYLSLLDETPSYTDEMKINLYGHRRVVDEMGWYNTLGVEAKLPLDFSSREREKVLALEQTSTNITQKSYADITQTKLLQLYQSFSDTQKMIAIDSDDISFLQRRVKRYEIIQKNMIPNLNYNPEDKILQLSHNIIDLEFQISLKRVELFKTLCNIAFLSNTPNTSYLIKGLK